MLGVLSVYFAGVSLMISKEKIKKVDIYDSKGTRLVTTSSISFPKDFFKVKGQELIMIKAKDLPYLNKDEPITAIFEYVNGTRIKYITKIDISTDMQMNFHVGDGEILEERRRSFKVNTEFNGICKFYERDSQSEDPIDFEKPLNVHFFNINLGGVLFFAEFDFELGDRVNLCFMGGDIDLIGEVIRKQYSNDQQETFIGYACKFIDVSPVQEEKIARFVFNAQVLERDKQKAKGGIY